jgi:hypothetical protein
MEPYGPLMATRSGLSSVRQQRANNSFKPTPLRGAA